MYERQDITSLHHELEAPQAGTTERCINAARAMVAGGATAACVVEVSDGVNGTRVRGGAGDAESLAAVAVPVAEPLAYSGRALRVIESGDRSARSHVRYAAIRVGSDPDRETILVVSGGCLPTHRLEAASLALADGGGPKAGRLASPIACGSITADLAAEFGADAVSVALFARAGLQLDIHTRAGDLVRRRLVGVGTVWADAARHGAAYALGDLDTHAGTGHLAALGMRYSVLSPLETESGVPVGTIGISSVSQLSSEYAPELLERSRALASEIMQAHARSARPARGDVEQVGLRELAARVGCRRFSVYMHQGPEIALLGCYAGDGTSLVAPPDPNEEALVRASSDRGVSIVSDGAAVVLLANGVMLYASDPVRDPMDAVRRALEEIVNADAHGGDEETRRAA